jgi:hypothetical protein
MMRNQAIMAAILSNAALSANPVLAQKLSVDVGPTAGVVLSSWRGTTLEATTAFRTASMGGGFATLNINKYLAIELQALYAQKGTDLAASSASGPGVPPATFQIAYKQNYVEVPLLLEGTFPLVSRMRLAPTVFVGPAIASRTSCTFISNGSNSTHTVADCDSLYRSLGASMRRADALVVFGGGFDIGPFAFLVRYDLGLTKIIVQRLSQDARTRAWLLSAGYRFRLGGR